MFFFYPTTTQTPEQDHKKFELEYRKCLAGGYKCGNITYEIQNNLKI